MKKILLVLAITAFGFTAINAQTAPPPTPAAPMTTKAQKAPVDVPDVVKNKFAADYPTIKDAKWMAAGKTNFAASFKDGGKKKRVTYSPDGTMLGSKMEIDASALPAAANDYITKNMAGQKISEATQVTEKGKTWYEVKVGDKASGITHARFDANGNFMAPKEHKAKAPGAAPAGK